MLVSAQPAGVPSSQSLPPHAASRAGSQAVNSISCTRLTIFRSRLAISTPCALPISPIPIPTPCHAPSHPNSAASAPCLQQPLGLRAPRIPKWHHSEHHLWTGTRQQSHHGEAPGGAAKPLVILWCSVACRQRGIPPGTPRIGWECRITRASAATWQRERTTPPRPSIPIHSHLPPTTPGGGPKPGMSWPSPTRGRSRFMASGRSLRLASRLQSGTMATTWRWRGCLRCLQLPLSCSLTRGQTAACCSPSRNWTGRETHLPIV